MKKRASRHSPLQNPSNPKPQFTNRLLTDRKIASADALQFTVEALKIRMRVGDSYFTRDHAAFLKRNLPHCFGDLGRLSSKKLIPIIQNSVPALLRIAQAKNGIKMFLWTMNRAMEMPTNEKPEIAARKIHLFIHAVEKIAQLQKSADRNRFFQAFDGVSVPRAKQMLREVKEAQKYSEIHGAISRAYAEATKPKEPRNFVVSRF